MPVLFVSRHDEGALVDFAVARKPETAEIWPGLPIRQKFYY